MAENQGRRETLGARHHASGAADVLCAEKQGHATGRQTNCLLGLGLPHPACQPDLHEAASRRRVDGRGGLHRGGFPENQEEHHTRNGTASRPDPRPMVCGIYAV